MLFAVKDCIDLFTDAPRYDEFPTICERSPTCAYLLTTWGYNWRPMSVFKVHRQDQILGGIFAALLFTVAGLALTRLLYEGLFPRFLWLGRPLPVFFLTGTLTVIGWLGWYALYSRRSQKNGQLFLTTSAVLSPLLLNLLYLFDPAVDLTKSRFLFAASLWLTAVLS